jgi:hypothetical protein
MVIDGLTASTTAGARPIGHDRHQTSVGADRFLDAAVDGGSSEAAGLTSSV